MWRSLPYPGSPAEIDVHVSLVGFVLGWHHTDMLDLGMARVRLFVVGVWCHVANQLREREGKQSVLLC